MAKSRITESAFHIKNRELTIEEYNRLEAYRVNLFKMTEKGNKVEFFKIDAYGNVVKDELHIRSIMNHELVNESNRVAKFLEQVKIV